MSEEPNVEAVTAEVNTILSDGGALESHVSYNGAWLVSASFPCRGYADDGEGGMSGAIGPKAYAGDTRRTNGDPRALAASFVADARAHAERMDAFFGVAELSEGVENPRTYDEATAEYLAEHPEDQPNERGDERGDLDIDGGIQAQETRGTDPIDADFTIEDLGGPDEQDLLEPPPPEDFAPEDFAPEPEAPQDRFIGLDDLDRVRSLRIGDVATEALRLTTLIEQAVSEQEGEFSNIQAYVVSNLDKHTGAFTPQDEASRATYGRFLELSSARSKIALIDARRKDATAFLIAAGRDEVVNFDVQAAFA